MRKMNLFACLVILITTNSCRSQEKNIDKEMLKDFGGKISRIEFSSFLFLGDELVTVCVDTTVRAKFEKYLKSKEKFKRISLDDEKEFILGLNLLYKEIFEFGSHEEDLIKSRNYLLSILSGYKIIDFSVDSQLILTQLDDTKRSLINNYEEGSINESWLIFFKNDPILLKSILMQNGRGQIWENPSLRLCNTFRENSIPVSVRHRLKGNIISHLKKYENQDIEMAEIVTRFLQCDVSVNRFD